MWPKIGHVFNVFKSDLWLGGHTGGLGDKIVVHLDSGLWQLRSTGQLGLWLVSDPTPQSNKQINEVIK